MQFRFGLLVVLTALWQSEILHAAPVEQGLVVRSPYKSHSSSKIPKAPKTTTTKAPTHTATKTPPTNTPTNTTNTPSQTPYYSPHDDPCTVTSFGSLPAVKKSCTTITIGDLAVPGGQTLDLTGLAEGTKVLFTGKVTFGYKEWIGPLVSVSGSKLEVTGTPGSLFDGGGASYWDGLGSNSGITKPKFFFAHNMMNSKISGLNFLNTPVHCFSIGQSQNLLVDSVSINNKAGYGPKGGHNTDAFDVGNSDGITINRAIVYNQDDCLAVNSGTNIKFTNGYCYGGHGVSIGSVGGRSNNVVQNVVISNTTIVDSENGVRIKTVYNATGLVSDIQYTDITLVGITKYGVVIRQDYDNGSPKGIPTAGVPIQNVRLTNVKGTVVSNATEKFILCANCHNFDFTGVSITGGLVSTKCQGVPYPVVC